MTTEVFVTGFGPFAHVTVNPSASVGEEVKKQLQLPGVATHFTELETSIRFTKAYFESLEKNLDEMLAKDPPMRVLLCHFGVHSGELGGVIRLEVEAFNELFAGAPDVDGVVFNHDPIQEADGALTFSRLSWFGEDSRVQRLQNFFAEQNASAQQNGSDENRLIPQWIISHDAGRYLCNYCLYLSLALQHKYKGRVAGVFIHVCDPTLHSDREDEESPLNPSLETQVKECVSVVRSLVQILSE